MQRPLLVWTSQKYQISAWKSVLHAWASFSLQKKESFDERQMAWSPSWESFSLYFLSKSQLHIGQTEPCCSPFAWHVKRQSVHFLPETSPVRRPLKTRSHKDNYAEHHFSMLHILAGHKEQQLIPVITREGTKTVFVYKCYAQVITISGWC